MFIVIEGLDGSGKATQSEKLYNHLKDGGKDALHLSFPVYNSPSSSLVKMYLNGDISEDLSDINAYAASTYYAVDRSAQFIKNKWSADFIIADRYTTSNMIYQTAKLDTGRDEYLNWLCDLEYNRLNLPEPDLVIYLDVPVEISQKLMSQRYKGDDSKKDLHEKNVKYLNSCRDAAAYVCEKYGWSVINCGKNGELKSIDEIFNEILERVEAECK